MTMTNALLAIHDNSGLRARPISWRGTSRAISYEHDGGWYRYIGLYAEDTHARLPSWKVVAEEWEVVPIPANNEKNHD